MLGKTTFVLWAQQGFSPADEDNRRISHKRYKKPRGGGTQEAQEAQEKPAFLEPLVLLVFLPLPFFLEPFAQLPVIVGTRGEL